MIPLLTAVIPLRAADAAHETAARFRHGAYSVPCPECHVPAGVLCLARRNIHAARRDAYRQNPTTTGLVPLLVGRAR
ncbi:zinc finger domain-containing protein [Streptomyces pseudogriseolus]